MENTIKELLELLIWKYQLQMKIDTYQSCLAKMSSGRAVFDRVVNQKCTFWVKSGTHEMFLVNQLIDEILERIDISEITNILADER